MPYSKTPTVDTYSSQRIPGAYSIALRKLNNSTNITSPTVITQDAGMVNLVLVKRKNTLNNDEGIFAEPRSVIYSSNSFSGACRGMFVWNKTSSTTYFFIVCGVNVFTATSMTGPYTLVDTLLTNVTTPVRFVEFIDSTTNTKKLVLVDGVEGYVYTSNASGTKIVDPDFPTPHIPFPVFLDGYLFLAKTNTGDIYNSDLNDPAAWTAGNYISSEVFPDDLQALVKVNNYLLAIGTEGSEYFYDAGNASGSPLARQEGSVLPFGTTFPNTIASTKDSLIFLANLNDGGPAMVQVQGTTFKIITSFEPLWPLIDSRIASGSSTGVGMRGFLFRQTNRLFYGLRLNGDSTASTETPITGFCCVYAFDTDSWTEFRYGSTLAEAFPVLFTAPRSVVGTSDVSTYFAGFYGGNSIIGQMRDIDVTSSVNVISDYISGSSSYPLMEIRTPPLDFGTLNLKTMSRFGGIFEAMYTTTPTNTFTVSWNDNDYNASSWSTPVSLNYTLNDTTGAFPFITQLGSFRRRAFKIQWSQYPVRVLGFEMDINKGMQ